MPMLVPAAIVVIAVVVVVIGLVDTLMSVDGVFVLKEFQILHH